MQRRCGIVKTKGELGTSSGRRETRFHPTGPPPPSRPLKTLIRRLEKISVGDPGVVNHLSRDRKFAYCTNLTLKGILLQQKNSA